MKDADKKTISPGGQNGPDRTALSVIILSCVMLIVFVSLNIFAMATRFDTYYFMYERKTVLPYTIHIGSAVSVILLCLSCFVIKKDIITEVPVKASMFTSFAAGMTGFFVFADGLIELYKIFFMHTAYSHRNLRIITAILAVPAAFYFLLIAAQNNPKPQSVTVFGYLFIIFETLTLIGEYFDMRTPLNSPPRIMSQMSCIAVMISMLYELRVFIGMPHPRKHIAFGSAAVFMTGLNGISVTVLSFMHVFPVGAHTIAAMGQISYSMYYLSRLISLVKAPYQKLQKPEDNKNEAENTQDDENSGDAGKNDNTENDTDLPDNKKDNSENDDKND